MSSGGVASGTCATAGALGVWRNISTGCGVRQGLGAYRNISSGRATAWLGTGDTGAAWNAPDAHAPSPSTHTAPTTASPARTEPVPARFAGPGGRAVVGGSMSRSLVSGGA